MMASEFFDREKEEALLVLCASRNPDASEWRRHGDAFFMGGLAAALASLREFDRPRYLALAEELSPGITQLETFELWLEKSPLRPSRFMPMLKQRLPK